MWNTLFTNVKTKVVARVLKKSKIVCENVLKEKSSKNFIRSVNVLYQKGILRRKYCSVRSLEIVDWEIPSKRRKRTEFAGSCKVPALISYKELMKFIDTQDSDKLRDIPQATAEGQNGNENEEINGNLLPIVPGHYTDLKERLLQMADLYLYLDHHKANFLIWFGREKGHFLVASGADGAPFGKANEACVWLVSFFKKELQLQMIIFFSVEPTVRTITPQC